MEIIKNPQIDFLGKAKYFVALSAVLIAAGIFWIASGHLRYGVEFSGGTQLIVQFKVHAAMSTRSATRSTRSRRAP